MMEAIVVPAGPKLGEDFQKGKWLCGNCLLASDVDGRPMHVTLTPHVHPVVAEIMQHVPDVHEVEFDVHMLPPGAADPPLYAKTDKQQQTLFQVCKGGGASGRGLGKGRVNEGQGAWGKGAFWGLIGV